MSTEQQIGLNPNSWEIIDIELHHRRLSWASLGRAIDVSDQVMANWRKRKKIPPSRLLSIASYFGWSIEQVIGRASVPCVVLERQADRGVDRIDPSYTQRAHKLAQMFDEIRDPAIRQLAYTAAQAMLRLAKAGQELPVEPTLKDD